MATYTELFTLFSDSALAEKVASAVAIKADVVRADVSATTNQKAWAGRAFANPKSEANRFLIAVLAANESSTITNIQSASDTQIQTNVDDVFQLFVDADAGV